MDCKEIRHQLHRIAEPSNEEVQTSAYIRQRLEPLQPSKIVTFPKGNHLLAEFDFGGGGKTVLLRADMDAVRVNETLNLPYKSDTEGVSHKCGHDGHSTIMLRVAEMLHEKPLPSGKVLLLFQGAEETGEGARQILESGILQSYNIDCAYALHNIPAEPAGTIICRPGSFTCSVISRPWNGQTFDPFESMIAKMKQLDGTWKYDYTVFDRWVEFMMSCGITEQIDCYTLVPWHYRFDYYDCATNSVKQLACKPGEQKYHDFIVPFLKDFSRHLREKGWFSRTFIAMDERPKDQMEAAWQTIQDADPEFKIEGAANYSVESEAADRIDDISVGFQYNLIKGEALARRAAKGQKITFYTCCNPDRPNTFTFSPPAESAYLGVHAKACGYDGYLRWAYNSWPKQPNQDSRFNSRSWYSGDCYLVYPDGSSIRFERLIEGIQAYEKIRLLRPTLNLKGAKDLDEMLRYFGSNTYKDDTDAVGLLRQMNDLLWKLSK